MSPLDAVPGVALSPVPIDLRPRTSPTGLRVKSARPILGATFVWSGRAGRYRPVFGKNAVYRRRSGGLGLCGTCEEPHPGERSARQQPPGNDLPYGPIG